MKLFGFHFLFPSIAVFSFFLSANTSGGETDSPPVAKNKGNRIEIPPSKQRSGDAAKGYDYLVQGSYIVSGVPLDFYKTVRKPGKDLLKRDGDNAALPYNFNAVTAPNGVRIVTSNCLRCHAQTIGGKFILGLGNSIADFSKDRTPTIEVIDKMLMAMHGAESPERMAYRPLYKRFLLIAPLIQTKVRGVNSADNLAFVLGRHRDPDTLEWIEGSTESASTKEQMVVPTDVPPLWHLNKKNALYYTGSGRGDFSRLMMASSLLTMKDSKEAAEIDANFAHVYNFLKTIKPPKWPKKIDAELAADGLAIFKEECAKCHGSYGPDGEYPNYIIKLKSIKTDPLLSEWQQSADSHSYAKSWFGKGPYAARLEKTEGYIAPPLDGIWATAPYLHNGSVPDLETLLNSETRPKFWQRTFNTSDYNYTTLGWKYEIRENNTQKDTNIYDTTLSGYGNQGHTYGDDLSAKERTAVIEYLKSL